MKKLLFALTALFTLHSSLFTPIPAAAQTKLEPVHDMWVRYGANSRQFSHISIAIAPGVAFNRTLFARAQFEADMGLWDRSGVRDWRENLTIGPALGVNFYHDPHGVKYSLVGAAARSVVNKNGPDRTRGWSYAAYDLGLEMKGRNYLIGAGVRHNYSLNRAFDRSRTQLYVKIGWALFK